MEFPGPHVLTSNPTFDFKELLKQSTQRAQTSECDHSAPFPPPPPHAPEPSPPSSPSASSSILTFEDTTPPIDTPPIPQTRPVDRVKKKKAQSHAHRTKKREREKGSRFSPYEARPAVKEKYVDDAAKVHALSVKRAHPVCTAYTVINHLPRSRKIHRLHELVGLTSSLGLRLQEWDGVTPMPVIDREGQLVAILAGRPADDTWDALSTEAAEALEEARQCCSVPAKDKRHRRGHFLALNCGVSHGSGQVEPGNLQNNPRNTEVLAQLNQKPPFMRMSGFATSVLATWMPSLHAYYVDTLKALHDHNPALKRIFPTSVFAATTYNFGPRTVCFKHVDFANLSFGMCAVTALGDFDPKKGGHLVLWDCGLVIEFPPGSTILIPSAAMAHSNTTISVDERRYSFTQYTAGGLFRWVENGFMRSEDFYPSLSPDELLKQCEKDANRWAWGLSLIPRLALDDVHPARDSLADDEE